MRPTALCRAEPFRNATDPLNADVRESHAQETLLRWAEIGARKAEDAAPGREPGADIGVTLANVRMRHIGEIGADRADRPTVELRYGAGECRCAPTYLGAVVGAPPGERRNCPGERDLGHARRANLQRIQDFGDLTEQAGSAMIAPARCPGMQ